MPLPLAALSLAQRLKTETAQLHRETEDFLLPLLHNLQSISGYAAVLKTMYGFHAPLEAAVFLQLPPALLPDLATRNRSAMALLDLVALGVNEAPSHCGLLPSVNNTAQAFGVLYVLEGSALGGKYISQMLYKNNRLSLPVNALQFFQGYGSHTGAKWTAFLAALGTQEAEADTVIDAANQTFFSFQKWMQETLAYESVR